MHRPPLWLLACFWGCSSGTPPVAEGIAALLAPCDPREQRDLVAAEGLQPVFEACGSNDFLHHRWSPGGLRLYYQTGAGPWLLDGSSRALDPLPIGLPVGGAIWFDDERLAFPEEGASGSGVADYHVRRNVLSATPLAVGDLGSLERGEGADEVLLLASPAPGEPRIPHRVRVGSGQARPAFPWLREEVEDFTYRASQRLVAFRPRGREEVRIHDAESGEERLRIPGARRAVLSADGRFAVVEGAEGPASSADEPRGGAAAATAGELYLLDLGDGRRMDLGGIEGSGFQWYDARDYWGSVVLSGIGGRKVHPNLVLIPLTPRLVSAGLLSAPGAEGLSSVSTEGQRPEAESRPPRAPR
ncbi:hypothetical protein L6R50_20480 [Myxococcota bacterium]|nr:hypothetical protein [Myxococcota bacterium]